jgi:hypothetical protein
MRVTLESGCYLLVAVLYTALSLYVHFLPSVRQKGLLKPDGRPWEVVGSAFGNYTSMGVQTMLLL